MLSASSGMANPVIVTSWVLPASMVAISASCRMGSPPCTVRVAVTGTAFSVTLPWFWTSTTKARSADAGTSFVWPLTSLTSPELPCAVTLTRPTPWIPVSFEDLPTLSSAVATTSASSAFQVR